MRLEGVRGGWIEIGTLYATTAQHAHLAEDEVEVLVLRRDAVEVRVHGAWREQRREQLVEPQELIDALCERHVAMAGSNVSLADPEPCC